MCDTYAKIWSKPLKRKRRPARHNAKVSKKYVCGGVESSNVEATIKGNRKKLTK